MKLSEKIKEYLSMHRAKLMTLLVCFKRICQQSMDEPLIELGCHCRGDLAKAHRTCIQQWFNNKGTNKCEVCRLSYNVFLFTLMFKIYLFYCFNHVLSWLYASRNWNLISAYMHIQIHRDKSTSSDVTTYGNGFLKYAIFSLTTYRFVSNFDASRRLLFI